MGLTRKSLKAMGLTEEQVDSIIEAHTDTVDGLKAEVERYKSESKSLPDVQKELEQAKNDLESMKKDGYKVKYDALKEEFDTFKGEQLKKETRTAKETAYRNLLKQVGINEKRIDAVLKVSDIDSLELIDGKIKDIEKITESVKNEWSDFIVETTKNGATTGTPPVNNPTKAEPKSLAEALREKYELKG